ncbi:RasGEF [Gaertneriomyces sp. JEL0708]|nr:RasGEF [Gaertneriomyces sp. JEL0708]
MASSLKVLDGKQKETEEEGHARLELDINEPWVPTTSAKQPAQTLNSKRATNDAPPVVLLDGGQRQRAWTGPSLPPYDSLPSLARPSPTTTHTSEGHSPLQSPPSLATNVQNDALADSLQELQNSFPVGCFDPGHDDCGSGTGFLVTGKGLTGTGKILGHRPIVEVATPTTLLTSPASASGHGQEFQAGASEVQPNIPTLLLPPDHQSDSKPRRLSPAHTTLHLRRASSPSLAALAKGYLDVHTDYITQSFRSRRASVDSSYGRSSDSLSADPDVVESRNTMDSGPWNAQTKRPDSTSTTSSVTATGVGNRASRFASSAMTSGGKDKLGWHTRSPSMSLKADIVVFDLLDVSPKETARQLTLMDSEVFRSINRDELASIAWTGAYKYDRTPSIVAATQHFNKITLWVTHEIVSSVKIKRRLQLLSHFINVAKCCLDLNNFNGLRSITAGLQATPVHRLERTWAMVGRRERAAFDKLCELMSPLRNSEAYRKRLAESKVPCVPYLGTWLSDLTFLNECLKKERTDPTRGSQAADRQTQIDALLDEIARYQHTSVYSFEPIPGIQDLVLAMKFNPETRKQVEDDQYRQSCLVEPKRVETPTEESAQVSNKKMQGLRNRIRGNSASGKFESVVQSMVSINPSLPSGQKPANATWAASNDSTDVGAIIAIGSTQFSSTRDARLGHSVEFFSGETPVDVARPGSSDYSEDAEDNRTRTLPSRFLREKSRSGSMRGATRSSLRPHHRRSKSGSAVTIYGSVDMSTLEANSRRESTGSASDILVSRPWHDLHEADEGMGERLSSGNAPSVLDNLGSHSADLDSMIRGGPSKASNTDWGDAVNAAGNSDAPEVTFLLGSDDDADQKSFSTDDSNDIRIIRPSVDKNSSVISLASVSIDTPSVESLGVARSGSHSRDTSNASNAVRAHARASIDYVQSLSHSEPVLQGLLYKKEETNDQGERASMRKWVRVWGSLYVDPARVEIYSIDKGSLRRTRSHKSQSPRSSISRASSPRTSTTGRYSMMSDDRESSPLGTSTSDRPATLMSTEGSYGSNVFGEPGFSGESAPQKRSLWRAMGSAASSVHLFGSGKKKSSPTTSAKPNEYLEQTILLTTSARVMVAQDYTKKRGVFRLWPSERRSIMFRADTEEASNKWLEAFQRVIGAHTGPPPKTIDDPSRGYRGSVA